MLRISKISLVKSNFLDDVETTCLVPRRLSLDENVRAKEGGKDTAALCTLPMVPCRSSPVARLYLAKNEEPEKEAGSSLFAGKLL